MKRFLTRNGFKMATVTLFTGTGLSLLPELLCPDKFKHVYELHVVDQASNRVPLPLPASLVDVVRKELIKTYPDKSDKIESFYSCNHDSVPTAGSIRNKKGGILGLPFNFKYTSDSQIQELLDVLKAGEIEFSSDHLALNFARTMILSDAAKRFAISRAIHQLSYDVFKWKLAALTTGCFSGAFLWIMCQVTMDLAKSAVVARSVAVASVVVAFANFVLIRALIMNHIDRKADQKCADMGPDYVAGGHEYYDKIITRNKVARLLGCKLFNEFGNETAVFTLKTRTVNRYDEFNSYCKSLSKTSPE